MYGQGYMVPSRVQTPPFFRPLPLYPISPLVHLCTTSSPQDRVKGAHPLCFQIEKPAPFFDIRKI